MEVKEANSLKIPTNFSFAGWENRLCEERLGSFLPTAVAYYHVSDMVSGGGLMKSLAGFLHSVVVRWLPECSWRSSSGISGSPMGTLEVALDRDYAHLLHGSAIKQRLLVNASIWHAHGVAIVTMGYMTKRLHGET